MVDANALGLPDRDRSWWRAPAPELVAAFAPGGDLAPVRDAVAALGGTADLHLWSDPRAQMHHARVHAGGMRLIDVRWEPSRTSATVSRGWDDPALGVPWGRWVPATASADFVATLAGFVTAAGRRAGAHPDPVARLLVAAGLTMLTAEYAPLFRDPTVRRATLPALADDVVEALDPPPVPGSGLQLSYTPDALAVDADGRLAVVRHHGPRAPELRFALAQAVLDQRVLADLIEDERQAAEFERLAAARRALGTPTPTVSALAPKAVIGLDATTSPRLRVQFEAVRGRLDERGVRTAGIRTITLD